MLSLNANFQNRRAGEEQGITLHAQKSHVGVKMCSAATLEWGWWQVQTLQNLMLKFICRDPYPGSLFEASSTQLGRAEMKEYIC